MVEVFKTNVRSIRKAKLIIQKLAEEFPAHKINFDLSDCDRILRVAGGKYFGKQNNQYCNRAELQVRNFRMRCDLNRNNFDRLFKEHVKGSEQTSDK